MYLICGEALYDVFVEPGAATRFTKVSLTAKAGGSPHNVAIALARLGCAVAIATEIAPDTLGRLLESRLRDEGVNCQFIRHAGRTTPLAMVEIDAEGRAHYSFHGLDSAKFYPELASVAPHWNSIDGIHVGSIPIVAAQSSSGLLDLVTRAPDRVLISFDPNIRLSFEPDIERWHAAIEAFRAHTHLIKVSEDDLKLLHSADVDVGAIAKRWLTADCSLVAVTRGERGVSLYPRSGGQIDIPAVKVVVADSIGAGDSCQAAMLAWLAERRLTAPLKLAKLQTEQLTSMGQFAMLAAASTCRHRGPEFPYRKALPDSF